jgi:hypothetical protein
MVNLDDFPELKRQCEEHVANLIASAAIQEAIKALNAELRESGHLLHSTMDLEAEACAGIADEFAQRRYIDGDRIYQNGWRHAAIHIAAAIRERKNKR